MFLAAGSHLEFADVLVGFFGRRCRLKLGFSNKFPFTAFPHSGLRPQASGQQSVSPGSSQVGHPVGQLLLQRLHIKLPSCYFLFDVYYQCTWDQF